MSYSSANVIIVELILTVWNWDHPVQGRVTKMDWGIKRQGLFLIVMHIKHMCKISAKKIKTYRIHSKLITKKPEITLIYQGSIGLMYMI
jgi:hypothetical protein